MTKISRRRSFICALLAAVTASSLLCGTAHAAAVSCPAPQAESRAPLYMLPLIEHMDVTNKKRLSQLKNYLEAMEPGGPKGQVQLGYVTSIMPYHFMRRSKTGWEYNPDILDSMLKAAAELNRPFVMGFTGNHFQGGGGELIDELMKDPQNLMHYRDGSVPAEGYFGSQLVPFAITNDESIPAMRIKFDVLRSAAKQLHTFSKKHPGLLVGITLNGETHYLFKDFYSGTGNFDAPQLTDFSPHAVKEFQAYLDGKKSTLKAEDILQIPFTQLETGYIPVGGWLESLAANQRVAVYADGVRMANVPYGLNRMDVYEAMPYTPVSPNTGFQTMLDITGLAPGTHRIDVVIETDGKPAQRIGARTIETANTAHTATATQAADLGALPAWKARGYLDWPRENTKSAFLPLAREWKMFREKQVNDHIAKMAAILTEAGFEPRQIFSYQLTPYMIGGWNPLLFGVGDDFFRMKGLRPGINLYGGNMLNEKIFESFDKAGGYGVPETHPQMEGYNDYAAASLNFHYCNGAVFLSPYFINVEKDPGTSDHDKMAISPKNTRWGSNLYYKALVDFVQH